MKHGIVLLAHGAREPGWALPFESVAAQLRALRPASEVRLAFLEFMAPDLEAAASALVQCRCTQVDVVPLFLGAGGHVRKDLPAQLARIGARHAAVSWRLQRAVGETDLVVSAMAQVAARLCEQGA